MPEYRRAFVPGGTFFLTIVTHMRRPLFGDVSNVVKLYVAIHKTQEEQPFTMLAYAVLADHMHVIWELPPDDSDFSTRVGRMKALFTRSVRKEGGGRCPPYVYVGSRSPSQVKHRESGLWQRRFWEHTIRDEEDFERHVNYIHYNPVKHELAACPHAWRESSFMDWVQDGVYADDWCCRCDGRHPMVVVEDTVGTAGE